MPDLSIPNNAIPIRFPGTRAIADIPTNKVTNPYFWPPDVPLPNEEFKFPHITLITKGFKRASFDPFHYGNTFLIRTIAWLVSIDFISPDDLTEGDRDELDEYRQSLEGQFVWSLPDDEWFEPTIELKNAWVEKYKRRAAFFHRTKVHDLVRRKSVFVIAEARSTYERLLDEGAVQLGEMKNFPPAYWYDRDLQGGKLRRVHPSSMHRGQDEVKEVDNLDKILNPPPASKFKAGVYTEWRESVVERFKLESHPIDSIMPPRRFWPIHVARRKRVHLICPVPQVLPPSRYMLQDAPRPVLCWKPPIKIPAGLRLLPMPSLAKGKEQKLETKFVAQGKVEAKENGQLKRNHASRGNLTPGKAAQRQSTGRSAGAIARPVKALHSGSTLQPKSSSGDKDVVMDEIPSPAPSEPQSRPPDVTMADPAPEGQHRAVLQERNAPTTTSNSVQAQKRKRQDDDSDDVLRVAPALRKKMTFSIKPGKETSPQRVPSKGTNQVPSARGQPLLLPKISPFRHPDFFIVPRLIEMKHVNRALNALKLASKIKLPNGGISWYEDLGVEPLWRALRSLAHLQGIERHRANPNRQESKWKTWRVSVMANWVMVPSPLRRSTTFRLDEETGEYKFISGRAFNHKWTVREYGKKRKEAAANASGQPARVLAGQPEDSEEVEDLGVVVPKGMPRKAEVDLGWRMREPRAVFGGILPGGGITGREVLGNWSAPVVPAEQIEYARAAGWTGQPLVEL